VRARKPR